MSEQLFTLIKSLEKAEKRFFRLYATLGAGPTHDNYLTLFDKIDALTHWDEAALLKSLKKKALQENLSSNKSRLTDLILKSQRLLRSGKTIGSQLRAYLEDIEFLLSKNQVLAARKRLHKAKTLARHFEEEAVLLQLLYWEQQIFLRAPDQAEQGFFEQMAGEEQGCLDRLALQQGLMRLHERIRSLIRTISRARKPEELQAYKTILLHPLMQSPPPEQAFYAATLFLQIRGTYHLALGEIRDAWDNFDLLMRRWELYADQIEHRSDLYLGSLNNYLGTCLSDPKFHPHFLEWVQRARHIQGISPPTRLKLERVAYVQELAFRMNFSTLQASEAFVQEMAHWLQAHADTLEPGRLLHCYYNLTQFHFVYGRYSQANRWLLKISHFPETDARQDIRDFARIFQVVLQHELENFDLQDYLLRSATRYLKQSGQTSELEEALLQWVRNTQKLDPTDKGAMKACLKTLLQRLLALQEKHPGRPPLGLQEMILWAESKIAGKAIGDYFQAKTLGKEI